MTNEYPRAQKVTLQSGYLQTRNPFWQLSWHRLRRFQVKQHCHLQLIATPSRICWKLLMKTAYELTKLFQSEKKVAPCFLIKFISFIKYAQQSFKAVLNQVRRKIGVLHVTPGMKCIFTSCYVKINKAKVVRTVWMNSASQGGTSTFKWPWSGFC